MLAGISECDTNPLLGAPDRTAMLTHGIAGDMKIEVRRNAERACDLEAGPAVRNIAHNAADTAGPIEFNRPGLEHFMPLTFPVLAHGPSPFRSSPEVPAGQPHCQPGHLLGAVTSLTLLPTIYENLSAIGDTPLTCVNDKVAHAWKSFNLPTPKQKSRSPEGERLLHFV
jgi:hypothetical protein